MTSGRLEAFTDGVVAIIITIMVLELKVPEGGNLLALHFPRQAGQATMPYVTCRQR